MSEVDAVLKARGNRYGLFQGVAEVAMALKNVISFELNKREKTLQPDQQEALDMICSKIARIVNGDEDYSDHWLDISGYAKLVADRMAHNENWQREQETFRKELERAFAEETQLELDLQGGKMNG